MSNIKFRLAKPSDAKQIAYVHYHIRDKYDQGFFAQVNFNFLKHYYKVMLYDPNEVIVCAEDENGEIVGFSSGSLDAAKQMETMRKHKLSFVLPYLMTALSNPSIIKGGIDRLRSIKGETKNRYVSTEGPRIEYWGWLPDTEGGESPVVMQEMLFLLLKTFGAQKLFFEVDKINKKVLKFHKRNGAIESSAYSLPDGRERVELYYDMDTFRFKYLNV